MTDETGTAVLERAVARLSARVEELEAALAQRSRELRVLQRVLCADDLRALARLAAGRPPRTALERWEETTALVETDVDEALAALWRDDDAVQLWRELDEPTAGDHAAVGSGASAAAKPMPSRGVP